MRNAVKITWRAKNTKLENCKIFGGLENSWENTLIIGTLIWLKEFSNNHPILYGSISAIIGGIITLIIEYIFFK